MSKSCEIADLGHNRGGRNFLEAAQGLQRLVTSCQVV